MWPVQSDKIKQHKKKVNYTINNRQLIDLNNFVKSEVG